MERLIVLTFNFLKARGLTFPSSIMLVWVLWPAYCLVCMRVLTYDALLLRGVILIFFFLKKKAHKHSSGLPVRGIIQNAHDFTTVTGLQQPCKIKYIINSAFVMIRDYVTYIITLQLLNFHLIIGEII